MSALGDPASMEQVLVVAKHLDNLREKVEALKKVVEMIVQKGTNNDYLVYLVNKKLDDVWKPEEGE